ncbi:MULTISPECIES: hypothetical protein [unclassified Micrococcus]|uniref:hypothetical protein n=1 Tax=unclassified Micrococcus TaxID=2620948 RepID=UPI0019D03371|nr:MULTISPECIES: hypothetical protein [unclassified Micrococcus]MCV7751142.1 hypothetical protein [Micrococcus luteus]
MSIEVEHLEAALAEAVEVVTDSERAHASTAACHWWHCGQVLRRFIDTPDAFPPAPPVA